MTIYSGTTTEDLVFELQGRAFRPGDLTRSLLLMCGGSFNSFYLHAQTLPVAEVLYLFETWLEVRQSQSSSPSNLFEDVEYR